MQQQCKQQLKCDFCDQVFNSNNNKAKHQRYCEQNPNSTLNSNGSTVVNHSNTSPNSLNSNGGLLTTAFDTVKCKTVKLANNPLNGNADLNLLSLVNNGGAQVKKQRGIDEDKQANSNLLSDQVLNNSLALLYTNPSFNLFQQPQLLANLLTNKTEPNSLLSQLANLTALQNLASNNADNANSTGGLNAQDLSHLFGGSIDGSLLSGVQSVNSSQRKSKNLSEPTNEDVEFADVEEDEEDEDCGLNESLLKNSLQIQLANSKRQQPDEENDDGFVQFGEDELENVTSDYQQIKIEKSPKNLNATKDNQLSYLHKIQNSYPA